MAYYLTVGLCFAVAAIFAGNRLLAALPVAAIMAIFAGTRLAVDNDYVAYAIRFEFADQYQAIDGRGAGTMELAMRIVPGVVGFFTGDADLLVRWCFVIFAVMGVGMSIAGLAKYSSYFALSVALYGGYIFLMHEMTAVRAGVASGFFLLALKALIDREHRRFLLTVAPAFLFHASSVLFVVVWALNAARVRIRYYLVALLVGLAIGFAGVNVISTLGLERIFPRSAIYLSRVEEASTLSLFNFRLVGALVLIVVLLAFRKHWTDDPWMVGMVKIQIVAVTLFYGLSPTGSVFSLRSYELLAIVQCLLIPLAISKLPQNFRPLAYAGALVYAGVQMYYLVAVSGAFEPYRSWLL